MAGVLMRRGQNPVMTGSAMECFLRVPLDRLSGIIPGAKAGRCHFMRQKSGRDGSVYSGRRKLPAINMKTPDYMNNVRQEVHHG